MSYLFAAFAAVLVASSLLVVLHRSPVTSALFLVLAFCSLAAMSMSSAFGAGNLANGIVEGLRMLVDQAQSAS